MVVVNVEVRKIVVGTVCLVVVVAVAVVVAVVVTVRSMVREVVVGMVTVLKLVTVELQDPSE